MVGILLVSHSETMVRGLCELLSQIGSNDVPIRAVGGTAGGELGTNADGVEKALGELSDADGVVVIPDLGSAVLTVKSVISDSDSDDVVLVDAPFVEGAVAAAVTAASGCSLDEVAQAAKGARDVPKF